MLIVLLWLTVRSFMSLRYAMTERNALVFASLARSSSLRWMSSGDCIIGLG